MENVIRFPGDERKPWWDLCLKNGKGKLIPNHNNAMVALRHDHAIRDVFAYDEMLRAIVMTHEIGRIDCCNRWVTEKDVADLLQFLQCSGFPTMGIEIARAAMNTRAQENAHHPVKDYLKSLAWDQVPRLGTWLSVYLGAELNKYTEHIGRMFLVSMVARIAAPGCQVDHMPVLEGAQGILKSSACRVLGGRWFSDSMPDITNGREASQHLRDKWLIEVSELQAYNRAETTLLKSFVSRREERYRPSYGRLEVYEPRQCTFCGTTNQDTYLKDATGGRRFWPVKTGVTGEIKLRLLGEDRDQLFAEAVQGYMGGDQWWPDAHFEQSTIKVEQAARYAGDVWESTVENYVEPLARVKNEELLTHALGFAKKDLRPEHQLRIASILRDMGWEPRRNGRERYWVSPKKPSPIVTPTPDEDIPF
jgi:predicted P-loop ATPase